MLKYMVLIVIFAFLSSIYGKETYIIKFKKFDDIKKSKLLPKYGLKKHFTTPDDKLLALKIRGEKRSNKKLSDLRTYYQGNLEKEQAEILKKNGFIQFLYIMPIQEEQNVVDIPPVTPDFTDKQHHLYSFKDSHGTSSFYGWKFENGAGDDVIVFDVEQGAQMDHEDIGASIVPGVTTVSGSLPGGDHGTAALGLIGGRNNEYGITGTAYNSKVQFAKTKPSIGDAIIRVTNHLVHDLNREGGDMIFIILALKMSGTFSKSIAVEWYNHVFDAIKIATANDVIVLECAGNQGRDFDRQNYWKCNGDSRGSGSQPCFDRNTRDSGAIFIGAGAPHSYNYPLSKLDFSSYGSIVDAQGWGYRVVTTGYGNLSNSGGVRQYYTNSFSGTSSATPFVTGLAAQIQSRYKFLTGDYLKPDEMRKLLQNEELNRPQIRNRDKHIGPQPDIFEIYENYLHLERAPGNSCRSKSILEITQSGDYVLDTTYNDYRKDSYIDNYSPSCANSESPDLAYKLILEERTNVIAEVVQAPFDTVLYIREACDEGDIVCDDDGGVESLSKITEELEAGTYYIIIDGKNSDDRGEIGLRVTLNPPCENSCQEGEFRCNDDGNGESCRLVDGCYGWVLTAICPEWESCYEGRCVSEDPCKHDCREGGVFCHENNIMFKCGQYDQDECFEWYLLDVCESGEQCSATQESCIVDGICTNQCDMGERRCAGQKTQICGNGDDGDNCLDWVDDQICENNTVCYQGECVDINNVCVDSCVEGDKRCSNHAVEVCTYNTDLECYQYVIESVCDHDQLCANGVCIDGEDEDPICVAGTKVCQGDLSIYVCSEYETSYQLLKNCADGEYCFEGKCVVDDGNNSGNTGGGRGCSLGVDKSSTVLYLFLITILSVFIIRRKREEL